MANPEPAPEFRWQALFQASTHPLFVLNQQRRLLFANLAWEACTGLRFRDYRGRTCRRRRVENLSDRGEIVLSLMSPPAEAKHQNPVTEVRRIPWVPLPGMWWRLHFVPLGEAAGVAGYLGWIHAEPGTTVGPLALPEKLASLRHHANREYSWEHVVADSPAMQRTLAQLRLGVTLTNPILITSTAKVDRTWYAKLLHQQGPTSSRFFWRISCKDFSDEHLRFLLHPTRLAQSGVGTLFLDHVQTLPRDLQLHLLDFLSTPETEAAPRWLFGIDGTLAEGPPASLTAELWVKIAVFAVTIPSLADRAADLGRLITHVLRKLTGSRAEPLPEIADETKTLLFAHAWQGDLAELQDVLRTALARANGARVEPTHLPFYLRHGPLPGDKKIPLDPLLEATERNLIQLALRLAENNHTKAAEMLGIWRARLIRRIEKLGIDAPPSSSAAEDESP